MGFHKGRARVSANINHRIYIPMFQIADFGTVTLMPLRYRLTWDGNIVKDVIHMSIIKEIIMPYIILYFRTIQNAVLQLD